MRKAFYISLLAVMSLAGCQVNEIVEAIPESKSFTATIEDSFNGAETRTSLDDNGNVRWKQGDQISIFVGSTVNEQYQVTDASDGKTSAEFNKVTGSGFVGGGEIDNNVAFYPYSESAEIAKNGSAYVISGISLPATQNYAEGSFGNGAFPMAAVTNDTEDLHLKFKNVLGGLKLQLKGTGTITSITVIGNNNEILCGTAEVTVSNTSTPSINLTDAAAKTVTLDCGEGVALDPETATPFIIALPPMTMEGGFTVVVTDTEGKQMEIKTTKAQTINRSMLLKMPVVTYEGILMSSPLTFTSTGKTSISLVKVGSPDDVSLEYSVNGGGWTAYTVGDAIALADGEKVSFRAGAEGNTSFCTSIYGDYHKFTISGSGTVAASGDIMSLLDREGSLTISSSSCFSKLFESCGLLTDAPTLPATSLTDYCYFQMFIYCTGLTIAPGLPATTLANNCYSHMFQGCTSLISAPELPATTMAYGCYEAMFRECTNLITAPELTATTLAENCYYLMFQGTGLTTAPELPATTLADGCYRGMFVNCADLTTAPELPATTLASSCYDQMFQGCTSLTTAPELPATTLASYCYSSMFQYCTGLTTAPSVLPATTLADHCCQSMFDGCTGLTTAPELPATTLAEYCYCNMFYGCTSLTTAQLVLPATTLAEGCYQLMFQHCTGLTKAPELPATTLAPGRYNCYGLMFDGCSSLNYIKALFTTLPSISYTFGWVNGVASTGIFVKSKDATWDVTGVNGVPEGWTVIKDNIDNIENPLTFTSTGETSISLVKVGSPDDVSLEYRVNGGGWTTYTVGDAIALADEEKISFRAGAGGNTSFSKSESDYHMFTVTGSGTVAASGDIMSLLDREGGKTISSSYCFCRLFYGCTSLTTAPELPATTLAEFCYRRMFYGCTSLTTAPELPATTLVDNCYAGMFCLCTGLTTAPELPASTLAGSCYYAMFSGCTSLTTAPELPATTMKEKCYSEMFYGCTSLTNAPELPATTLAAECYMFMFEGCTSLTTAPELPATKLSVSCYARMFERCTSLTTAPELPATTLAARCYYAMFYGCTGLTTAPELPATTLAEVCYWYMFGGCTSLTTAPELPAPFLDRYCYAEMFYGCTSLTTAPELPATTLSEFCYRRMFYGCTSLTTAPELPATTLVDNCYREMFSGCSSLNYVKALFTTSPGGTYTNSWLTGVASTGTFVKSKDATWDVTGVNGVPEGWTVSFQ